MVPAYYDIGCNEHPATTHRFASKMLKRWVTMSTHLQRAVFFAFFCSLQAALNVMPTYRTRKHSSRMRTILLPTVHVLVAATRCQYQWGGWLLSGILASTPTGIPAAPPYGILTPPPLWDTRPSPLWDTCPSL